MAVQTPEQARAGEAAAPCATGAVASARIAALFPMAVCAAEIDGTREPAPPHPAERLHLLRAAPRRWRDFVAGRDCARHALAGLGIAAAALLPRAEGGPRWPEGVAGSISHAQGLCGAVACRAGAGASLGLDLERLQRLDDDLLAAIATPAERDWLRTLPQRRAGPLAMVLFSAKEAFYKCQHPLTGRWLEFRDVTLRLHDDGRIDLAGAPPGLHPSRYGGRYRIEAEHVLTGFWTVPG